MAFGHHRYRATAAASSTTTGEHSLKRVPKEQRESLISAEAVRFSARSRESSSTTLVLVTFAAIRAPVSSGYPRIDSNTGEAVLGHDQESPSNLETARRFRSRARRTKSCAVCHNVTIPDAPTVLASCSLSRRFVPRDPPRARSGTQCAHDHVSVDTAADLYPHPRSELPLLATVVISPWVPDWHPSHSRYQRPPPSNGAQLSSRHVVAEASEKGWHRWVVSIGACT